MLVKPGEKAANDSATPAGCARQAFEEAIAYAQRTQPPRAQPSPPEIIRRSPRYAGLARGSLLFALNLLVPFLSALCLLRYGMPKLFGPMLIDPPDHPSVYDAVTNFIYYLRITPPSP
jgi:hypothetical protein